MYNLRFLLPYVARYRTMLGVGLLCAVCGAAVSVLGPYILRLAIDDITTNGIVGRTILFYSALIVLTTCVDGAFKFGQRMLIAGASHRVDYDMREALFDCFMTLDQQFYSQVYTGDLMARATNDLKAVRMFLGPGINGSATALFTLAAASVLMFQMNVMLASIVLLLLPLSTIMFALIGRRMHTAFKHVQDQFGGISTRAQENFSGIRTVKAYAQEQAEIGVFAQDNTRYRQLNLRYVLLSGLLWPTMTLIIGSVAALVLLLGGRLVTQGALTIGELVQFNAYLGLLTFPMIILGWLVGLYQEAAASIGRLVEVYRRQATIRSLTDTFAQPQTRGAVEFRNVGLRFEQFSATAADVVRQPKRFDEWMLRHVNIRVPAGTSLAIVGATGAGKTTLVNLLGRVRDPDEGQVLLDGVDVRLLPLDDLRRQIGYVPQETFLFSVPLRENVTFGLDGGADASAMALDQRLEYAVETSRLSNDLAQFPNGLDTMVGERGVTLSGGQKQRVAIARAVLRDPLILVLDDALSSVDTHTAAQILAGLREMMRDRTSIIIAQRIATVKDADQTVLLHDGRIVEQGTHHDLIRQGGRYAEMYRRELLEAELSE